MGSNSWLFQDFAAAQDAIVAIFAEQPLLQIRCCWPLRGLRATTLPDHIDELQIVLANGDQVIIDQFLQAWERTVVDIFGCVELPLPSTFLHGLIQPTPESWEHEGCCQHPHREDVGLLAVDAGANLLWGSVACRPTPAAATSRHNWTRSCLRQMSHINQNVAQGCSLRLALRIAL